MSFAELRSQEKARIWKPRIARFGVHSKAGVTFQSARFERKTSPNLCIFITCIVKYTCMSFNENTKKTFFLNQSVIFI
jgi:hypothetical protein